MMDDGLRRLSEIVRATGGIGPVAPDEDFYEAGFPSINALNLLLELETEYDVTLPDDKFVEARNLLALQALITRVQQEQRT